MEDLSEGLSQAVEKERIKGKPDPLIAPCL
jgi:hypothetical protein